MLGVPFDVKALISGPEDESFRLSLKSALASALSLCTLVSWVARWGGRPSVALERLCGWLGLAWNANIDAVSAWFNDAERRDVLVTAACVGIAYVLLSRLIAQQSFERDYRIYAEDASTPEPKFDFRKEVDALRDWMWARDRHTAAVLLIATSVLAECLFLSWAGVLLVVVGYIALFILGARIGDWGASVFALILFGVGVVNTVLFLPTRLGVALTGP